MITTQRVGNRTVYWTDNDKEWADLVEKGHIVYTATESSLLTQKPDVFDEDFRTLLYQIKILAPGIRLVGVK